MNCTSASGYYGTTSSSGQQGDPIATTRVCGSDGKIYASAYAQQAAGVDLSDTGCSTPDDSYACAYCVCGTNAEYCVHPILYTGYCFCLPLPAACSSTPSCDCVKDEMCGGACQQGANGQLTVQCNHG
jgi:hypothetical protein